MSPSQVAALLQRHGLAPHWRRPVQPAPILAITEETGVVHRERRFAPTKLSKLLGWYRTGDLRGERRTWT